LSIGTKLFFPMHVVRMELRFSPMLSTRICRLILLLLLILCLFGLLSKLRR
jgi:hypothetical protein